MGYGVCVDGDVCVSWDGTSPSYCDLNKKEYNVMGTGCMSVKTFQRIL